MCADGSGKKKDDEVNFVSTSADRRSSRPTPQWVTPRSWSYATQATPTNKRTMPMGATIDMNRVTLLSLPVGAG